MAADGEDDFKLDDLVKELDAVPAPASAKSMTAESPAPSPPPAPIVSESPPEPSAPVVANEETAVEPLPPAESAVKPAVDAVFDLDATLADFDPGFAAEAARIVEDGAVDPNSPDIEATEVSVSDRQLRWYQRLVLRWNAIVQKTRSLTHDLKEHPRIALKYISEAVRGRMNVQAQRFKHRLRMFSARFSNLESRDKWRLMTSVGLACLACGIAVLAVQGKFPPELESPWVLSMKEIAEAEAHFDPAEGVEDFNDPFLHPEHVVLIDRVVVNLRRTKPNSNPMAVLDVYLQVNHRIAALEIRDREAEIRDQIGRATEKFIFEDLRRPDGKTRLKLVLRRDINEAMVKGRVRRVFIKSLVLNPE